METPSRTDDNINTLTDPLTNNQLCEDEHIPASSFAQKQIQLSASRKTAARGIKTSALALMLLLPVLLFSVAGTTGADYNKASAESEVLNETAFKNTDKSAETDSAPLLILQSVDEPHTHSASAAPDQNEATSYEPQFESGDITGSKPGNESPKETPALHGGSHRTPPNEMPELPAMPAKQPTPDKTAYITIDDGPSRTITPGILDLLLEEGVLATFFVLPHQNLDDIYLRIIDEGHEIGNHSYTHNYSLLYGSSVSTFKDDAQMAKDFMLDNFDYKSVSYRFPGGSLGRPLSTVGPRIEALAELGYRHFNWHIDSGDAHPNTSGRGSSEIVEHVLSNTRGREHLIILFHDSSGRRATLEALPRIITGLREQGYAFDILCNYPLS